MRLFAVIGNPVLHSKSPIMFNAVFEKLSVDAVYTRLAVDDAVDAMQICKDLNFQGINVTAPFKRDILDHLDHINSAADQIGGVNTVVFGEKGCRGYNTDYSGVVASLQKAGVSLRDKKCVVLGAGGAGRAAAFGLIKEGADVVIVNRTEQTAIEVAAQFGCRAAGLANLEALLSDSQVLVSTLAANIDIVQKSWLRPDLVVLDANYNSSKLSKDATETGGLLLRGEEWLLNQAVPAYRHFLDSEPQQEIMKSALRERQWPPQKKGSIALIGFMGCGKSTIGKSLARKLKRDFIDTDDVIEQREGMSISDIFKNKGEEYFRKVEKDVVEKVFVQGKNVVACGGGVVLSEHNRRILSENALVIWTHLPVATCVNRIEEGTRPILDCDNPMQKAQEIYFERIPQYARSADLVVNASMQAHKTAGKIYEEICRTFGG